MSDIDKRIVNLQLNSGLWRKVKAQAALEGKTVVQWVSEVLKKALNKGGK